jgi:thioredoxin reductase
MIYDCIVIGAGPAGLSASLFLARYRHKVLAFHNSSPRNLYSHGVHGFLGHDGIMPSELLARGRDEVARFGGLLVEACVTRVERLDEERFRVTAEGGGGEPRQFEARRLLLATGLRDLTPDCKGFREFYGATVHHCPDCDGYEVTGKRVVVLGNGEETVGFILNMLTWTDQLTLVTNGDDNGIIPEHRAKLAEFKIDILNKEVKALEGDYEQCKLERVRFTDGSTLDCDALFFNLGTVPATDFHTELGCELDPTCGLVAVNKEQQTSVKGIYAAGDITPHSQLAIVAAAEGAMAAIHIHKSLIPEEQRLEVRG